MAVTKNLLHKTAGAPQHPAGAPHPACPVLSQAGAEQEVVRTHSTWPSLCGRTLETVYMLAGRFAKTETANTQTVHLELRKFEETEGI